MKRCLNLFAAAAAAWLAATAPAQAAGVTDKEIVVGSMLDLSGPAAAGMPQLRNGMQLRIDELNAAGGVHGRKIRLIVEDNAGTPQQAVRAAQKLIRQDGVFATINNFGSGPGAATVKAISDAGVVNFAPWATSGTLHQISGNSPLLFTVVQNYNTSSAYGLSWALKNWGSKKVGTIIMEGPFGELMKAGVASAIQAAGLTLAAEASYKPGEIDFSSHVARMKAAGVDLIFAGTIVRETIGVMAEVKKLGWKDVKVLSGLGGRNSTVVALGKDAVEGLYGIAGWSLPHAVAADPAARRFIDAYRKAFNIEPDETASNAYSYADWFIAVLQAAGPNLDAQSFGKAAAGVTHQDFTTFAKLGLKDNHVSPEMIGIDVVKGGRWEPLVPPFTGMVK
jgi:branched-chain amino acid transport system substrate-binding protein